MIDPLADKARADWEEVVAEVGAACEMDHTWCTIHQQTGSNGRCHTGRALDDMAATLSMLILERMS